MKIRNLLLLMSCYSFNSFANSADVTFNEVSKVNFKVLTPTIGTCTILLDEQGEVKANGLVGSLCTSSIVSPGKFELGFDPNRKVKIKLKSKVSDGGAIVFEPNGIAIFSEDVMIPKEYYLLSSDVDTIFTTDATGKVLLSMGGTVRVQAPLSYSNEYSLGYEIEYDYVVD